MKLVSEKKSKKEKEDFLTLEDTSMESGLDKLEEFKQQCTTLLDKQSVYWMMKLVGLKYVHIYSSKNRTITYKNN